MSELSGSILLMRKSLLYSAHFFKFSPKQLEYIIEIHKDVGTLTAGGLVIGQLFIENGKSYVILLGLTTAFFLWYIGFKLTKELKI